MLARDLPALRVAGGEPFVRDTAELVERSYQYPVDSMVLAADGKLLDHVCANDLTGEPQQYLDLLDRARQP